MQFDTHGQFGLMIHIVFESFQAFFFVAENGGENAIRSGAEVALNLLLAARLKADLVERIIE